MLNTHIFFQSVEIIWSIWLFSSLALCAITLIGIRRMRHFQLTRVWSQEDGAAYTLGYVMVLPFLMLLVCAVIETSTMLVVKMGTIYSAYSGVRTRIVQFSPNAEQKTNYAAVKAFVPFASGIDNTAPQNRKITSTQINAYLDAYTQYVEKPASEQYLRSKFRNAESALVVNSRIEPAGGEDEWDDNHVVEVTYRYPFRFPGIGVFLGRRAPNGSYYTEINTELSLQSEAPQNKSQKLGISYASP